MPHPGQPEKPIHLKTHKELDVVAGFIKNNSKSATTQKKASRFLLKKKIIFLTN